MRSDERPTRPQKRNKQKPPRVRAGQLWQLGRHRLLCGDATRSDDVARLMGRRTPRMLITDPPYGVNYAPKWREKLDGFKRTVGSIENDDRHDWTVAYRLFTGDVAYVWHAGRFAGEVSAHLAAAGLVVRAQIIWRKSRFVISRGHYHWQHEPCWYAVRKGRTASWCGDRKQRTVWDIVRGDFDERTIHPAQKPVECLARAIRNHGEVGDWIYDPFAGSGSTLVAAEVTGRSCLGIDIDPTFCMAIIARFEALTGKRARRLE